MKPFDCSVVKLVVDFLYNNGEEENYRQTLMASSRRYRHLVFRFGKDDEENNLFVDIMEHFCDAESLKLLTKLKLELLGKLLEKCSNLRVLRINAHIYGRNGRELEIPPLHNLEELLLPKNCFEMVSNMKDITPNITRLHMTIGNDDEDLDEDEEVAEDVESLSFLQHFSPQLKELDISFPSEDNFMSVCKIRFPLLEKLRFEGLIQRYEPIYQFFGNHPLLMEVTIMFPYIYARLLKVLQYSCDNLRILIVCMEHFSELSWRAVCQMKNLQRLTIKSAIVDVPREHTPLENLEEVKLEETTIADADSFRRFASRAFPNLRVLEMLHLRDVNKAKRMFQVPSTIYSTIPSVERLVICGLCGEGSSVRIGELLNFCATRGSQEVRLSCQEVQDEPIPQSESGRRIPVQKMFLKALVSPAVLRKLVSSMSELRYLEIVKTRDYCPDVIDALREEFPRCCVVVRRKVYIHYEGSVY